MGLQQSNIPGVAVGIRASLDAMGLHKWYTGTNRDEAQSADVRVRTRYDEENRRLFHVVLKQLERDSIQAKKMRMMIKSDFGNDRDGYGLIEYLTMWANDLTQAEIKRIKRDIAAVTLKETDTPDGGAKLIPVSAS